MGSRSWSCAIVATACGALLVACKGEPRGPTRPQPPNTGAEKRPKAPAAPPRATLTTSVAPPASAGPRVAPAAAEAPEPRPELDEVASVAGLRVLESSNTARHMHGGARAKVHTLWINLDNALGSAHRVRVTKLSWLNGDCHSTDWDNRKPLRVAWLDVNEWDESDPTVTGTTSVVLPAKADWYQLGVHFDAITAYQACDRFGAEVELEVDGKRITFELPYRVVRYEPRRRP